MITIKTNKIEKAFGLKVIPNITCLGVDTASRTGWCKATTYKKEVMFDFGIVDIKTSDKYFKYNRYIETFKSLIDADKVVIEESYYSKNVKTFQMLSRIGAFAYASAHLNKIPDTSFILATSARKYLGFKGNAKKEIIQKEFIELLNLKIDDNDVIDAMILSLVGILEEKGIF